MTETDDEKNHSYLQDAESDGAVSILIKGLERSWGDKYQTPSMTENTSFTSAQKPNRSDNTSSKNTSGQ